jgi:molybdate transport system substrate-binding protein
MVRWLILLSILTAGAAHAPAAEVRVAVAANFAACLEALAGPFAQQTGHDLVVIQGSTGRHHAQIVAGAPFDVFLAADARRPADLERRGLVVPGSRFCYAVGELVLWWPDPPRPVPDDLRTALLAPDLQHLALANPRLAPYGEAAVQTLESLDLPSGVPYERVQGQNIVQTWQFVASGNAEAGLVARSLLAAADTDPAGLVLTVPPTRHDPIEQHAVLLRGARQPEAAAALLDFLRGEAAGAIIASFGYRVPPADRP